MRDIKIIIVFLFFLSAPAFAQTDSLLLKNASGKTLKKLGKNALQQNDPGSAITFFEAYLKTHRSDAGAMYLLGHAYYQTRDYERAQRMFLRAWNTDKEKAPEALYYHAQMQKSNGLYDSAKISFQKFKKEYKGNIRALKKTTTREIDLCDSVQRLVASENKIVVNHLDTTINKVNTEAAPALRDDNTLVFTSLRTDKKEYISEEDSTKISLRKLYYAVRRDSGEWVFAGEYGSNLNDPGFNTGNACFSPDRQRIYFTKCKPNFNEVMTCAIYVSERNGDTWSEPVKLPKTINNPKYTATMPSVAVDPKGNEVIYFVSNRPEGKGGRDIWLTVYNAKNKTYKAPRNAGAKINTGGDEISPWFDNETRTLYFSSDGMSGLGGFDVFRATGDGKKWLAVENVGQPINSGADDIFYVMGTKREEGFFVSNRRGGNSLKNATCCDDIYYYKHSEYVHILLAGTIKDAIDTSLIIPNALIEIYAKDNKTKERVLIKSVRSDSLGRYNTSLEADRYYMLVVKKDDCLGTDAQVSTVGVTQSRDFLRNLGIAKRPKEPVRIPNIQYEFDKSNILESSKLAIDTTILRLLENNPEIIVEIQSHTDNKGSDQYNLKLSQKRAESVVSYLIAKGIRPERLKARGYGESTPVAPNENSDGSDNPDGRAQNRRTDFRIIGVLDFEVINAADQD